MKTILSILAGIFLTMAGFAQYRQTQYNQPTVTISFNSNGNNYEVFQVVIDGTSYYSNNGTNNGGWNNNNVGSTITLTNLQPGQHSVQVFRTRANNSYGRNSISQPLYSSTFILRQGYDANLAIRGNGQVEFTERAGAYNNGNRDWRRDRDRDGDNDDRRNRGYNGGYNNRMPMAEYQFGQLLQSVRNKWFQSSKVTAERNAFTSTNYFSTYQVTQLLQLITNENNRLELAELSYRVVVDPQNFTQVYSLFSSQNKRNELDRYIRGNRY